jgi:hypothetical protein
MHLVGKGHTLVICIYMCVCVCGWVSVCVGVCIPRYEKVIKCNQTNFMPGCKTLCPNKRNRTLVIMFVRYGRLFLLVDSEGHGFEPLKGC